jgi:hypothetical protein
VAGITGHPAFFDSRMTRSAKALSGGKCSAFSLSGMRLLAHDFERALDRESQHPIRGQIVKSFACQCRLNRFDGGENMHQPIS